MTPELIMLVGLPGSGKSTWMENFLRSTRNSQHWIVSSDMMIEEAARECEVSYNVALSLIPKDVIGDRLYRKVDALVKDNQNFIWDQTNLSSADRRLKLQRIPLNWKRKCVVFELPIEEIERRRKARELANPGKTIPPEIIEGMQQSYERPTMIEGWDEIVTITS